MKTFADKQKTGHGTGWWSSASSVSGVPTHASRDVGHILRGRRIQMSLAVGAPNDILEQEADRVADTVMGMSEPATGESPKEEARQLVSPKADGGGELPLSGELADRIQGLEGGGVPLGEGERAFFEPRFGADFSQVRVHTDPAAAEAASAINARAFTLGSDIVFGPGRYAPGTDEGKRLLAHELTHVLQQEGDIQLQSENLGQPGVKARKRIRYDRARELNRFYAGENNLGWEDKLATVAGGAFSSWAELWNGGNFDEFADAVAEYQEGLGWADRDVDGVLGLATWSRIAGFAEAMAGIRNVSGDAEYVCTLAVDYRIRRGKELVGEKFELPKDRDLNTYNIILQSIPGRMLDVEEIYRGTGPAGALVYAGLAEFVEESDIWSGELRPGAAIQVWGSREAYDLLRLGEIEEGGKKRRINDKDANFFGTSFVFVRYDSETNERMLVRHYGNTEWKSRGSYEKWVAANIL